MASHKDDFKQHKLVFTGDDPVPVDIKYGAITKIQDLKTTQEEADTIIIQQVTNVSANKVLVVADDIDISNLCFCFNFAAKVTYLHPPYSWWSHQSMAIK